MSDDEITREADPSWLTRLHEGADDACHDGRDDATDADDDHTIGNADLLDQVRAAVREARGESPSSVSTSAESVQAADPAAMPAVQASFPPPDPTSPVHQAKAAPTLTFPQARWQPPPRLKPVSAAQPPALLTGASSGSSTNVRRRMLVVGVAAAIAALIVGVLIGRNDSSDPTPGNDTVVSTADTTTGNTTTGNTTNGSSTGNTTTGNTTTGGTTTGTGAEVGS